MLNLKLAHSDLEGVQVGYGFMDAYPYSSNAEKLMPVFKSDLVNLVGLINKQLSELFPLEQGYSFGVSKPSVRVVAGYHTKMKLTVKLHKLTLVGSDIQAINEQLIEKLDFDVVFDYNEESKLFLNLSAGFATHVISKGYESVFKCLSLKVRESVVVHVNCHQLNLYLQHKKPSTANYLVQFTVANKSNFIYSLKPNKVVWMVTKDFFLGLRGSELENDFTADTANTLSKYYSFVNVISYIQYGGHEHFRDFLPQQLSNLEFKNIRTLIGKTSNELRLNCSPHSQLLYSLDGFVLKLFERVTGAKVGRVHERFYQEVLALDVRTDELIEVTSPTIYKVGKKNLTLM